MKTVFTIIVIIGDFVKIFVNLEFYFVFIDKQTTVTFNQFNIVFCFCLYTEWHENRTVVH